MALAGLLFCTSLQALIFDVSQIDGINGFTAEGGEAFEFSGISVSAAGDINGDGQGDVLVGSFGDDSKAGKVYVLFGRDVAGTSPFSATIDLATLSDPDGFVINGAQDDEIVGFAGGVCRRHQQRWRR